MSPGEPRLRRRTHPLTLSKLRRTGQPLVGRIKDKLNLAKLEKVGPLYHLAEKYVND
jgi:hypothetical protein